MIIAYKEYLNHTSVHFLQRKSSHSKHLVTAGFPSETSHDVQTILTSLAINWRLNAFLSFNLVIKKLLLKPFTPSGGRGVGSRHSGHISSSLLSVFLLHSRRHLRQYVCKHKRLLGFSISMWHMPHWMRSSSVNCFAGFECAMSDLQNQRNYSDIRTFWFLHNSIFYTCILDFLRRSTGVFSSGYSFDSLLCINREM